MESKIKPGALLEQWLHERGYSYKADKNACNCFLFELKSINIWLETRGPECMWGTRSSTVRRPPLNPEGPTIVEIWGTPKYCLLGTVDLKLPAAFEMIEKIIKNHQ